MTTEDILNYYQVDDRLITGGQPTEAQIRSAAQDGIQVVINLATLDPRYSLEDEAGLVQSLGLEYHHIPVDWERPALADYDAFAGVMQQIADKRTLIHCAANYRVTAFCSLYALQHMGWTEARADALRAAIWRRQYPVWDAFIETVKTRIKAGQP